MKPFARFFLLTLLLVLQPAHAAPLRFVWLSDTTVGSSTGETDLRAAVRDINALNGYSFVIVSGDVTESGSHDQLLLAKSILDKLQLPCHVIPGGRDCEESESGATEFGRVFGSDRFVFDAGGFCFIGQSAGPVMRLGDGHFAPQDARWLAATLSGLPKNQPVIFVTHQPADEGIDNWFVVLDKLKKFNTQAILAGSGSGHGTTNFAGVPVVLGRSGYSLIEVDNGVMTIGNDTIPLQKHDGAASARPDFSVNSKYPDVRDQWQFDARWTTIGSPTIAAGRVFAGDASGKMRALSLQTGAPEWEFAAAGPIYSTPAVDRHRVVFASADGSVYAVRTFSGRKAWQFETAKPIVASPVIFSNTVYIGAGDGKFRALGLTDGKLKWEFSSVSGFVQAAPLYCNGKVIFGASDGSLYALNATNGELLWKSEGKNPGNPDVTRAPAAAWSAAVGQDLFVAAPDRQLTVLDMETGYEIWRVNNSQVGSSIGLAENGSRLYARTADNGAILAFATTAERPEKLWELDDPFGPDINASMLAERRGVLYCGTKDGVLLAIDPRSGTLLWEHKLGATALNTVTPLEDANEVLVSDADGKITRVGPRQH